MKQCPFCKENIEDGARFCLHCMSSLDTKQRWKAPRTFRTRWRREIAAFLVLTVVLGAVWWVRPDQPSIPTASTTQNTVGASGSSSHTPTGDSSTTPTLQANGSTAQSGHTTTNGTASQTDPLSTVTTLSPLLPQPLVTGGIPTLTLPPAVTTTSPTTPKTTTATTTTTTTTSNKNTTTTTTSTKKTTTTTTTSAQGTRIPLEVKSTHPQPGTRFYVRDCNNIHLFPYGEETKDLYVEIVGVSIYIAEHPYLVGREVTYMDIVIRTPPSEYETRLNSRIDFEMYDENDELVSSYGLSFDVTQPNSFQTITWEIDATLYSYTFIPSPEWSNLQFVPIGGQNAWGELI